jgi:hypothetical protein
MKRFRRLRRVMGLSLVTVALVVLWAVPGTATAAIQLGQASTANPVTCGNTFNQVQRAAVTANYQVPSPGGVITSWSHRGRDTAPAGSGRLQVWDSTGGNNFVLVGRSELEDFTAGLITTFLTRIPVDPGDLLGLRNAEPTTGCGRITVAGDVIGLEATTTDPEPGDERTLPPITQRLMNVAAVLEPDADGDGFGDETQDACLDEAGPEFGCLAPPPEPPQPEPPPPQQPPPPPPGTPPPAEPFAPLTLDLGAKKQKVKKKVKLSATATADSTLVAEGKKIKDTTKQLAANEKTTVKAKLKRKARNRLEEKGKGKVKVTATATDQSGGEATDQVKVKLKD